MAGFKGDVWRNKALDAVFGGDKTIGPDTLELALYNSAPTREGGGIEVSGPGYGPLLVPNDSSLFGPAVDGEKKNLIVLVIGVATGSWGTVTWGAWRDPADHSIIYAGPIETPPTIVDGDPFEIPVEGFVVTEL